MECRPLPSTVHRRRFTGFPDLVVHTDLSGYDPVKVRAKVMGCRCELEDKSHLYGLSFIDDRPARHLKVHVNWRYRKSALAAMKARFKLRDD